MTYAPPPVPASANAPRLRGRTPLRLGIIFLILGIVGVIVGGVIGFKAGLSKVDNFQRVSVAQGSGTIHLGTGEYVAYYEAPNFNTNGHQVPIIQAQLTNVATGQQVSGTFYGNRSDNKVSSLTYDWHGHHGAALYQFHIAKAGAYHVEVRPGSPSVAANADLAFGTSIAKGLAAGGIVAIVGAVLFIAGLVLLIVGLVKRSRSKKELAAVGAGTPYGGFGAPMYGQPPSQPGYGQPQTGQQPSQPQYGQPYGTPPPPPPGQPQQNPWPPQDDH